jgi:hypothetical protein
MFLPGGQGPSFTRIKEIQCYNFVYLFSVNCFSLLNIASRYYVSVLPHFVHAFRNEEQIGVKKFSIALT